MDTQVEAGLDPAELPVDPDREMLTRVAEAEAEEGDPRSALDWLLSDDPDDADTSFTHALTLDVGTPTSPKVIRWVVRPVDGDTLKAIGDSGQNRQQRRRGAAAVSADLSATNRKIVLAGTVDPDLAAAAQAKGVADPEQVLKWRFRHKPGLIDQMAAIILELSGYDDEAIKDAVEVRAAGN